MHKTPIKKQKSSSPSWYSTIELSPMKKLERQSHLDIDKSTIFIIDWLRGAKIEYFLMK
jgi:hypothetical protein